MKIIVTYWILSGLIMAFYSEKNYDKFVKESSIVGLFSKEMFILLQYCLGAIQLPVLICYIIIDRIISIKSLVKRIPSVKSLVKKTPSVKSLKLFLFLKSCRYKWIWNKTRLTLGYEWLNMTYYEILYIHLLIGSIQLYTPFREPKEEQNQ